MITDDRWPNVVYKLYVDGKEVDFEANLNIDLNPPAEAQLRGILNALRVILEVPSMESILAHTAMVMRQYKRLKAIEKGGLGPMPPRDSLK